MRSPNAYDVQRLYSKHEEKDGFKGMLGSIDCMHWEWKNCPVALKEQYTRGDHKKPTIMLEAVASVTLVKGFACPTDEPRIKFTRFQASARKDVERVFGALQGRFHILRLAARTMSVNKMRRVMDCCVILHNMILEDQGFALSDWEEDFIIEDMENRPECIPNRGRDHDTIIREIRYRTLHDQQTDDLVEHIWNLPSTFCTMN
ncbi:uncharacterized protein [Rutidosis leptorrhynchoides]|uniref:uncharacterized protein n=1 Tax=Rutidosis leptorrhynchoides TaxID=125765 RepID=UPI003A991E57